MSTTINIQGKSYELIRCFSGGICLLRHIASGVIEHVFLGENWQAIVNAAGGLPSDGGSSGGSGSSGGGNSSGGGSTIPSLTVGTTTTTLVNIPASGIKYLGLQVTHVGGDALNLFEIYARVHPSAPWVNLADSSTDYTTIAGTGENLIRFACGNPVTLAVGENFIIGIDGLGSISELKVDVSSTGTTDLEFFVHTEN